MTDRQKRVLHALLDGYGRTYAAEAGIRLKDTPQPLYRTLVLATLLSARIRASIAVETSRALYDAGLRDARRMVQATWQQRVDALGAGGYRRYDERTATRLGDGARLLLDDCGGDLRRLRERADGDVGALRTSLGRVPGLGPTGVGIFLREVQDVWAEFGTHINGKALQGAERLGLPKTPATLTRLAGDVPRAQLAAALVRAALDRTVAEECRAQAA
ncbi:endonuclease [Streptomyces sp. SID5785]|uniref:endonuclease n=1 Tax=Streptomyces sp. SID5785 TaxID=2690309 RepID=UPI001361E471|nr:endonuclease [Streptomyces sp. SID5785]MZD10747.1 endonuclease [Streptomyces sp. SID5785]